MNAEIMGWNVKAKRWFKKQPGTGKVVAVGCPTLSKMYPNIYAAPTKEGSRSAANQWWRDQLAKWAADAAIDRRPHGEFWQAELAQHKARHQWLVSQGDQENDEQEQIEIVEAILAQPMLPDPHEWSFRRGSTIPANYKSTNADAALWADRLARRVKPSQKHSLATLVATFLKARECDTKPQRLYVLRNHLSHLTSFMDSDDIRQVDGLALERFKSHILGTVSRSRASNIMGTVKRFLYWAEGIDAIEKLPKNLRSRDLRISVPPQTIIPWGHPQVKLLFSNLHLTRLHLTQADRHRLWYLLMLNCGIQAQEISDLSNHDPNVPEVARKGVYYSTPRLDWDKGTITRKRGKTAPHESVPIVCCKLWSETMALLEKLGRREGRVLASASGRTLVRRAVVHRMDTIGREFRRLRMRIKRATGKTLPEIKTLRHTASTELETHKEFGRYAPFFLGHSPEGMSARHYVVPSQENFDEAVDYLRSRFLADITSPELELAR